MPGIKFIPKELRQIEHFIDRETDKNLTWWFDGDCTGDCCADEDMSMEFGADLDSYLPDLADKFDELAKKYNLHVTTDWRGGYIYAEKKGVNDANRSEG